MAEVGFDVVVLLVAGTTMLITGALLFPVSAGLLPYYENGLYGLLLFIFALQMVTLGRTPFGDTPRSKPLLMTGVGIAALGIITCFIPDIFSRFPRIILSTSFGPGGAVLMLQMIFSGTSSLNGESTAGYSAPDRGVHGSLLLLCLDRATHFQAASPVHPVTAVVALLSGASLIYLAFTLQRIYSAYRNLFGNPREIWTFP